MRKVRNPKKTAKRIILIVIIILAAFWSYALFRPIAPRGYEKHTQTGGAIEEKYIAHGEYKVKKASYKMPPPVAEIVVYYPSALTKSGGKYPMVLFANGTGVLPNKYKAVFKHLASWGFIVAGNYDPNPGNGLSMDDTLSFLLEEKDNPESIFYNKIDEENIGIAGHSQGGAAVLAAISLCGHKDVYKCAAALSPAQEDISRPLGWTYDLEKIQIPVMLAAGTETEFENQVVIPLKALNSMYDKLPAQKVMMRRIGMEHGGMLYTADGYVTAWFMYHLKEDKEAGKAFLGENPEILENDLYCDQRIDYE